MMQEMVRDERFGATTHHRTNQQHVTRGHHATLRHDTSPRFGDHLQRGEARIYRSTLFRRRNRWEHERTWSPSKTAPAVMTSWKAWSRTMPTASRGDATTLASISRYAFMGPSRRPWLGAQDLLDCSAHRVQVTINQTRALSVEHSNRHSTTVTPSTFESIRDALKIPSYPNPKQEVPYLRGSTKASTHSCFPLGPVHSMDCSSRQLSMEHKPLA